MARPEIRQRAKAQDQAEREVDMQERGYSLVEMVAVIGIMSILLAYATLNFPQYFNRYRSEAQTRMIFTEISRARSNAVFQRRETRVKIYPTRFEVYSSAADNTNGVAPVNRTELRFPVSCNANGDDEKGRAVTFEPNGLAKVQCSICLADSGNNAAVDSIIVNVTRASIGKRNPGKECDSDGITIR